MMVYLRQKGKIRNYLAFDSGLLSAGKIFTVFFWRSYYAVGPRVKGIFFYQKLVFFGDYLAFDAKAWLHTGVKTEITSNFLFWHKYVIVLDRNGDCAIVQCNIAQGTDPVTQQA